MYDWKLHRKSSVSRFERLIETEKVTIPPLPTISLLSTGSHFLILLHHILGDKELIRSPQQEKRWVKTFGTEFNDSPSCFQTGFRKFRSSISTKPDEQRESGRTNFPRSRSRICYPNLFRPPLPPPRSARCASRSCPARCRTVSCTSSDRSGRSASPGWRGRGYITAR
jgi:hypothetical protein